MKNSKTVLRIAALALSLMLVLAGLPLSVFAESTFVSENLLETKIDMSNSTGVIWYRNGRTIEATTARGTAAAVTGLVDGDLDTACDITPYGVIEYRTFGIRYALTESSYVSQFKIYADLASLPSYYDIFVSESLEDLHFGANYIGTVKCSGPVQTIDVNRNVKYLMILANTIQTGSNCVRPREVQLWSGDPTAEFTPTNLVKSEKLDSYSAVLVSGESAGAYAQNNAKAGEVVAKAPSNTHTDMYTTSTGNTGIQYNLTEMTYIGKVLVDAGLWNSSGAYDEKYAIYASATATDLYAAENMVASDVSCAYGAAALVDVNKYAQYVAVVCTEHNGVRIRNIAIYDAKAPENEELPFVSQNVLRTNAASSRCIQFYPTSHYVGDATRISADKIANLTDGNTTTTTDCYSALDWDPARYIGVEYTLDDTYYIGELEIFSGYTTSKDTFDVYASDSFDTLYNAESLVAEGVVCEGTKVSLTLNKDVKYVTFLISGVELYCARIAEFEAWTAEKSETPAPTPDINANLTIGKQTKGDQTRLIMKLTGDAATIEAYETVGFKLVIDGVEQPTVCVDSVYDSFYNNGVLVTAANLNCTYVAILEIGSIADATSVTAQGVINGTECGAVKTLK